MLFLAWAESCRILTSSRLDSAIASLVFTISSSRAAQFDLAFSRDLFLISISICSRVFSFFLSLRPRRERWLCSSTNDPEISSSITSAGDLRSFWKTPSCSRLILELEPCLAILDRALDRGETSSASSSSAWLFIVNALSSPLFSSSALRPSSLIACLAASSSRKERRDFKSARLASFCRIDSCSCSRRGSSFCNPSESCRAYQISSDSFLFFFISCSRSTSTRLISARSELMRSIFLGNRAATYLWARPKVVTVLSRPLRAVQ